MRHGRTIGIGALVVFFAAALVVIAALGFSVVVTGDSMSPTVRAGDRLSTDLLHRDDIRRFDLVKAQIGEGGPEVIKRVVALPGETVQIDEGSPEPRVLVTDREGITHEVTSPTWSSQIGTRTEGCCDVRGRSTGASATSTVPDGEYWVIGDNWGGSDDSREFGYVQAARIRATLNFRILPWDGFGRVPNPVTMTPVAPSR